jgi:REP element-mobilizing transposase RayT
VVFCTKNKSPLIHPDLELALYKYINGIAVNIGANILAIGGISNHIHISASLPAKLALSEFAREIKGGSSWWLNGQGYRFYWQQGYSAFTIHESLLPTLKKYILNQKKHHETETFEAEERRLFGTKN